VRQEWRLRVQRGHISGTLGGRACRRSPLDTIALGTEIYLSLAALAAPSLPPPALSGGGIVAVVAFLAKRSEVQEPGVFGAVVVDVRGRQYYVGAGDWMWLVVPRAAPFTAVASPHEPNESAA
jgi:hypothetical protein